MTHRILSEGGRCGGWWIRGWMTVFSSFLPLQTSCCLLWIEKTRDRDKTYEWGSVWWETQRWSEFFVYYESINRSGIYMSHRHCVGRQNKPEIPREKWGQQVRRNPRMWWASARSRHDGSPTDTQADTQTCCTSEALARPTLVAPVFSARDSTFILDGSKEGAWFWKCPFSTKKQRGQKISSRKRENNQ